MQGTATPASATGNAGGQLSGAGQQQGAGQGQQGMDPSQMLSGMTGALTGALSSIGQAASGIVSAITEGISSIPFDQMGQGLGDDQFDGRADEAADKKDEAVADGKKDPTPRWRRPKTLPSKKRAPTPVPPSLRMASRHRASSWRVPVG